jgi:hypothetical protein
MLNTLASSSCTIGVLTPIAAAVFYGAAPKSLGIGAIIGVLRAGNPGVQAGEEARGAARAPLDFVMVYLYT